MHRLLKRVGFGKAPHGRETRLVREARRVLFEQSGLFDPQWYLDQNPDIRDWGRPALDHLTNHGALEWRNPGPDFDTAFYAEMNPSFSRTGLSPLEHYLRIGREAGLPRTRRQMREESEFGTRLTESGLLDADWYLTRYPEVRDAGFSALEHIVMTGAMEWRDPSPAFDAALYVEQSPDCPADGSISPLEHYLRFGKAAGIICSRRQLSEKSEFGKLLAQSGLLDEEWYLRRHADVRSAGLGALEHLVMDGAKEGRDPGPGFDAALYVEQSPDFPTDGSISPLEHHLRFGGSTGNSMFQLPAYERWVNQFATVNSEDKEAIERDVRSASLPSVAIFQLASSNGSERNLDVPMMPEQYGIRALHRRIIDAHSIVDATRVMETLPDGAIAILVGSNVTLRPHASYSFACALSRDGQDAAYSDHDHEDTGGRRSGPVFKPGMSPEFMRRHPYAGRVVAVRLDQQVRPRILETLTQARGTDPARAFADLVLGLDRKKVVRVPLVLYSVPSSDRTDEPGLGEIHEFVPGDALDPLPPIGTDLPQVRIVIPTRDRKELLEACISSIHAKTDYPRDRYAIVVVDNGSSDPASLSYLRTIAEDPFCSVVPSPGPFNFSKICNEGAAATDGDVLVFLNNDMTIIDPGWLATLASHAIDVDVGVVGAKLLYPNDAVQHGGVVLGLQGVGAHRFVGHAASDVTRLDATREMTAVTGACLAIRRSVFEEVGGFDPTLAVAFNDVRLCIQVSDAGYRNIYVSHPLLYHHESMSRGFDDTRAKKMTALREAIYVRSRHGSLFRDDPSYSPNLSLQRIGELAVPPRYVVPWRRSTTSRRVLILSLVHGLGHGVAYVVALQAEKFLSRGWDVTIGGPISAADRDYPGCTRVRLVTERQAAAYAVEHGYDCIIAHTSPFFSLTRYLGRRPLFYVFDHGEPPLDLFEDHEIRERQLWEKRFCAPLAHRVFVISRSIYDEQYRVDAQVLRNGNTHLATWTSQWAERRSDLRRKFGFEGQFVIFNVCRFHEAERRYKGVDIYATLAAEVPYMAPALSGRVTFVLAGRGDDEDVAYLRKLGIVVFPNITNGEMAELYAASDLYISLSQWEGYNLGIAQALAMGLPVVASDIPAHREFEVPTTNAIPKLCALVAEAWAGWDETAVARTPRLEPWDTSLTQLVDILEEDVAADRAGRWL